MFGRTVVVLSSIFLAFVVLMASIFASAPSKLAFNSSTPMPAVNSQKIVKDKVDYDFVFPGKIAPDNPLWYLKALRDKLVFFLNFNSPKKAELNLLFADKRIQFSKILFEKNKPDLATSTLYKSQMYLSKVDIQEDMNNDFLKQYLTATLKHRQMIEEELIPLAPEDLKPKIIKLLSYSKDSYNKVRDILIKKGIDVPDNPFGTE